MVGINVISEFIMGWWYPGAITNLIGKTFGCLTLYQVRFSLHETDDQGLEFTKDMKLGLYMKIPPRAVFRMQLFGTIVSYHPL
jgi:hypothetical protein